MLKVAMCDHNQKSGYSALILQVMKLIPWDCGLMLKGVKGVCKAVVER